MGGDEELPRALDGADPRRGIAVLVGTAAALVATTAWSIPDYSATALVVSLWLLGPVAVVATVAAVLVWTFGNERAAAHVLHVSEWSVAGTIILGLSGGLAMYIQHLNGLLLRFTWIEPIEWACGGFVIGSFVGVYSAGRRVQERRLCDARREAENLAETLSVLNRVLRHDIRNDVNVIEGYVDLIAADADTDADEHVEVVRDHTSRIVQLADYARDTEQLVAEGASNVERMDVVERLDAVCRDVRAAFPDATVVTDFPDRAEVRANRLVCSAFENLVENAIEHHPEPDPRVRVSVDPGGDATAVVVADDGLGIPDDEVAVLESGAESALEHSDGMGLWLVNWIVTYSGGDVEFAENDPTGSEITVRLPAAADE